MKTQLGRVIRTNGQQVKGCDSWVYQFTGQGEKKFLKKTTSKAIRRVGKIHMRKDIERGEDEGNI